MLDYAFLFPIGILITTVAMSSGVSGSNFWIPIYLLWLGLEPKLAFWMALLTMLFGFGSGVVRNLRAGTIDFSLVRRYGVWALPATAVGAWLSRSLPPRPLLLGFAVFISLYGLYLSWRAWRPVGDASTPTRTTPAVDRALLAGSLQGLIATGAGSVLLPCLLSHRLKRPADAVGGVVVLVFACSLTSVALRLDDALWQTLVQRRHEVLAMMSFIAPAVVIGGQLGPRLAARLPLHWLRRYTSLVLVAVGLLVFWRAAG